MTDEQFENFLETALKRQMQAPPAATRPLSTVCSGS